MVLLVPELIHCNDPHVQVDMLVVIKEQYHKLQKQWNLEREAELEHTHHAQLEVKHEDAKVGQEKHLVAQVAYL